MAAIKEKKLKAQAKVARAEKALESARKEFDDVLAAERVLSEITGESTDSKPADGPVSDRDKHITRLLPTDKKEAVGPAELLPVYLADGGEPINLEAFRTAVWRLSKKVIKGAEKTWVVKSEGGKYWRVPVEPAPEPEVDFEAMLGEDDDDSTPY